MTKKELTTKSATVTDLPLPKDVSTLQSSQNKTENQSSVNTTERPVSTSQPDASPSQTSILPPMSTAIAENISQSQGTAENGNDQPQSDKESVKLLTVKTISHESGKLPNCGLDEKGLFQHSAWILSMLKHNRKA
ncbi:Endomucin [Myotis brandtii]|uniref:Endomucin n=1 Tax=Myotis brandtii TaxID=109478 RepID=S7P3D2_MYOBR|nr:Endomucin [Myotis brandtii]